MRKLFKVDEAKNGGNNWHVADLGTDRNGKDYILTTNSVPASECSGYVKGAKEDGELIARLLNWYWNDDKADAILEEEKI